MQIEAGTEVSSGIFEGLSQIHGSASVKGTWHMEKIWKKKTLLCMCSVSIWNERKTGIKSCEYKEDNLWEIAEKSDTF